MQKRPRKTPTPQPPRSRRTRPDHLIHLIAAVVYLLAAILFVAAKLWAH